MSFNRLSHENMVKLNTERLLNHYRTERIKHYKKFYDEDGECILSYYSKTNCGLNEDDYNDSRDYLSVVKKELDKRKNI